MPQGAVKLPGVAEAIVLGAVKLPACRGLSKGWDPRTVRPAGEVDLWPTGATTTGWILKGARRSAGSATGRGLVKLRISVSQSAVLGRGDAMVLQELLSLGVTPPLVPRGDAVG
mmetsp:Transcript_61977/g.108528  ORF Transcript_61977/g.108528 Transcript_61977/m.108528 type:complete len:114 (+) Transcript_61977:345-686(+)